jgi:carbamoyltransferase
MQILGISAFYHDSAAAILKDGKIIAAAQEERFTRKKHDDGFPVHAIRFCLEEVGASLNQLDAVVFYDKPFLKFERLLETYYGFSPKGLQSFVTAMPVWIKEKIFFKKLIYKALEEVEPYDKKEINLLFPEHHLSHAASAFYPSPFEEAAILTIDGVGEWATATIAKGKGKDIEILRELHFPHSVGLLYSAFTYFLGFRVNNGEYKLMGLAPYGNPHAEETKRFVEQIKSELIELKEDGSLWLNQKYFRYATGLRMIYDKPWEALFGLKRREGESLLTQQHCNLAFAIQQVTEEIVFKMAAETLRLTEAENLCLAGGVALNCVANGKLERKGWFKQIFIQPAAGDAGGSLGAALAAHHIYFGEEREVDKNADSMQGAFLGPAFSDKEIELALRKQEEAYSYSKMEDFDSCCTQAARLLAEGKIVGWFQGRMEYGPRALGHRSILGDPRQPEMQKRLNLKIKYRESFRPFAPAVLAEDVQNYFQQKGPSPYMLLVAPINQQLQEQLPGNYYELPLMERLYVKRSDFPAITHLDFSARVQTVDEVNNPDFHGILKAFKALTGHGMLVNTSFNVRGEPIVCSPEDAINCFLNTEMDYLVMENYIVRKESS